jgi:hypothetical protein
MVDAAGVHHPQTDWPQTQAEAQDALARLLWAIIQRVQALESHIDVREQKRDGGVPVAPLTKDDIRDALALLCAADS